MKDLHVFSMITKDVLPFFFVFFFVVWEVTTQAQMNASPTGKAMVGIVFL